MLRLASVRFSLGGRAPNPFVNAALQLCQLHKEHRLLKRQLLESASALESARPDLQNEASLERRLEAGQQELDEIEQDFFERLESLRPIFHATKALESNRMYSAKIFNALRYFRQNDDPMFKDLSRVLGALKHAEGSGQGSDAGRGKSTRTWTESQQVSMVQHQHDDDENFYSSGRTRKQQVDDAVREALLKVRGGYGTHRSKEPEFHPSEFPAPAPDDVSSEVLSDPSVVKMGFKNRGHWVLREPGIAASRNTRKLDPW